MDEVIEFCGYPWYLRGNDGSGDSLFARKFENDHFGELTISSKAYDYIHEKKFLYYKFLSLFNEQRLLGIKCSLVANNEHPIQWRDSHLYLSCTVDQFLKLFPSDFIAIQHRSLLSLYRKHPKYGQLLAPFLPFEFFAQDEQELGFILEAMIFKKWLFGDIKWNGNGTPRFNHPFKIESDGWLEIERSINRNRLSQVFIAMWFHDTMNTASDAIKKAIQDSSLNPLRIDEKEHINQISTEIQYEIKNSGLVIADVTGQNQGVYFEAGYAMGLNIPVIWCCRNDEKDKLHFDIRQYNNILWENEDDLYNRLKNRIIAITGLL
jgi:hypothetical protein